MTWLERQWYRWTPWHVILLPLSLAFWLLSTLRRALYRLGWIASVKLPAPVIVVGNIAVGGTGKTPLVIALIALLKEQGYRPGIISRGYRGKSTLPRPVRSDSDPAEVGDEPVLLAMKTACPVWIGQNRVEAGMALLGSHPEVNVIVSDDGLQHYRMQRDVEVVVIDAERWFGNGQLLPAGPLREPPLRLKQADVVVINGWLPGAPLQRREFTMQLNGDLFYNLRNPTLRARPEIFVGQTVHAVAGIGHPERFFKHLKKLGMRFSEHPFPDHHAFTPRDLAFHESDVILMTEKDAVKCVDFAGDNVWVLPIEARLDPGVGLAVLEKLRSSHGSETA
ncbi:MAG: tetraacyldisaccharide 4'-kinase [Burkholderiales bacterium]|nr:tetraacyldisaccharide 4'-kinase [Burkholderiales bacterium]